MKRQGSGAFGGLVQLFVKSLVRQHMLAVLGEVVMSVGEQCERCQAALEPLEAPLVWSPSAAPLGGELRRRQCRGVKGVCR